MKQTKIHIGKTCSGTATSSVPSKYSVTHEIKREASKGLQLGSESLKMTAGTYNIT